MIYLDHHAATPVLPAAREAMAHVHQVAWANPSSVHRAGRAAKSVIERARQQVAFALAAQPADIVFTAGGTEACNLALLGLTRAALQSAARGPSRPPALLCTGTEHPAVAAACAQLAREGVRVRELPVPQGVPPPPSAFAACIDDDTKVAAVQWVNHETGTVFPVAEYAAVCAERGVQLVVDGSQALGKVPVSVRALGAAALVVASAKVGGPAGGAALWLERCAELAPLLHGGAQERGRRPGTPDAAALAGFGEACAGVPARLAQMPRIAGLRDRLEAACVALGGVVNGREGPRVATVTHVSFRNWRADMLVPALDIEGLCASAGAACSSGVGEPSPVLRAMYPHEPWRAECGLRLSLGPETTDHDIDQAIAILTRVLPRGRVA